MSFRKLVLSGLILCVVAFLAAACGTAEPAHECVDVQDGQLAAVPCTVPDGVPTEVAPTFEPPPTTPPASPAVRLINSMGCGSCHAIPGVANGQLGPDLAGIGAKGADYIRESIVNPDAVIAPNCPSGPCQANVMPTNFGDRMSSEEIDTLVTYLEALQ